LRTGECCKFGDHRQCRLCDKEAEISLEGLAQRGQIHEEIVSFLSKHPFTGSFHQKYDVSVKVRAADLAAVIRDTYPSPRFERLPRLACGGVEPWVAWSSAIDGCQTELVLKKFLEALSDVGYFVTITGDEATVDCEAAGATDTAITASIWAAVALEKLGLDDAGSALRALAKQIFITINGAETGFKEDFEVPCPFGP
jgi:hypothetical protein